MAKETPLIQSATHTEEIAGAGVSRDIFRQQGTRAYFRRLAITRKQHPFARTVIQGVIIF